MLELIMSPAGLIIALLALIILGFVLFSRKKSPSSVESKKADSAKEDASYRAEPLETGSEFDELSDEELIAVLTAAVMASMGNDPECKLKVKSFRRIPQTAPIWNTVGRSEYISGKL